MNFCVTEQPYPTFPFKMTEIYVKVKPDSPEFKVEDGHIPKIFIESKAENGKANSELKRRLEKKTGEKPGIISGHRSRRKKIVIDMPEGEFRQRMRENHG